MGKMYNLAAYDSELVLCPEAAARWVAESSVNSSSRSSGGRKVSFGSVPSGGFWGGSVRCLSPASGSC